MEGDEESRKTELRTERKLNKTIFYNILEYFQYYPEIDLFASRLNAQLLRLFSYRPDPFAEVTNAFSVSWEDKKIYCFPPFACIDKILKKKLQIKQLDYFSGAKLANINLVPILIGYAY